MKYNFIESSTIKDVLTIDFDLAIFACGYEVRSSYLLEKKVKFKSAICFSFEHESGEIFARNLNVYENSFIPVIRQNGNSNEQILKFLSDFFGNLNSNKIVNVLVDYSSMSRVWYSTIIYFIKFFSKDLLIDVYYLYSIPKFENLEQYSDEIIYEPVEYISQITVPDKPTALIISLGDTKRQAIGLKEYFDAEEIYCYYATSKYKDIILQINSDLIKTIPPSKLIGFPLRDPIFIKYVLENLCRQLQEHYRIVIAPCGPKPFTLISFLVSTVLPGIDVWRISKPGKTIEKKEPSGEFVSLKVKYSAV